MSAQNLAQTLVGFKQAGGKAFVDEPVTTLTSKFAVYKFFEREWPQMFKRIYTRQQPALLQQQIAALRTADRAVLVAVPHEVTFALLRSITMPHDYQPTSHELTVNRRQTGHVVKEFATHCANVETIHSGFKLLPADGFLLALGDTTTVDTLLISHSGRLLLSASPDTIQNSVLPALERFSSTARPEKLADLCALLSFSGLSADPRLNSAFKAAGLIEVEADINEVRPSKAQLGARLDKAAREHRVRCTEADVQALIESEHAVEKVTFAVPEISGLSKNEIRQYLADIAAVKPILEEHKLNLRGQTKTLVDEIKELLGQRSRLMENLDFRTYYQNHPRGLEAGHVSRSFKNQSFIQLHDYKQEIEGYISVLSKYQFEPTTEKIQVARAIAYY